MSADVESGVYALLTDGTTILIRPARPDDFYGVRGLHEKMSPNDLYLRFFSLSPSSAEREARRICREPGPDRAALLLRVSQMADDLPEIADLELSPVVARPDGVHAVDARIRLRPAAPEDTDLRRLR